MTLGLLGSKLQDPPYNYKPDASKLLKTNFNILVFVFWAIAILPMAIIGALIPEDKVKPANYWKTVEAKD